MTPAELRAKLPADPKMIQSIQNTRDQVRKILRGHDSRLLVIVGPCSIHDVDAALEYALLLKNAASMFADDLYFIMRTYFEKPRTTTGWRGLINDPYLNHSYDINHGLFLARKLLLDLHQLKVPCATEFLDTFTPQYLSDLMTWCAIGARTSASQIHREFASGLAMPVGFKNNTDGNIQIAIDAVMTAQHPHHYLSINDDGHPAVVSTQGNADCHIILRGSQKETNYHSHEVTKTLQLLRAASLPLRVMIDCSHGNSMKNYLYQQIVATDIANQIQHGQKAIRGVMIESHIIAGNQSLISKNALTYGQSITDACLGWKETLPLFEKLALAVRRKASIEL